jgi:SulP family sulfate permease
MFREFIPKSYLYLRSGYTASTFKKDLLAGITVGIIALPLAMAFAIASGTTPDRGLFTAIIAGFLISALGGSRVQIGGPTGAFVVIIYDIIQRTGYEGLAISTLIAAGFLVLLGLFRIGSWIKYIPHPLITGFTTGLAVLIFSSQIKDFFGLNMGTPPPNFIEKWAAYTQVAPSIHLPTFLLGVGTLAIILAARKWTPRIPWGISAIVTATLVSYFFQLPVETIASKFDQLPSHLPMPTLPSFHIPEGKLFEIIKDAVAIAFLGAIESLLSALIGDGMIGGRHKSNCELVGQGLANFASILFGGIPATGAIARTAANVKTGGQTPVAGMIHALTLFLIILFLSPVVSQIPLAALAAVLIMVAWNMSEAHLFFRHFKAPLGDVAILLTAFFLTIFVDIIAAISLGMVLASFLFMKQMSQHTATISHSKAQGIDVYEIRGPFFFGTADILKDLFSAHEPPPKVLILRLSHHIDASGMNALKEFYQKCHKAKIELLLSDIHGRTEKDLHKFGITHLIGPACMLPNLEAALQKAHQII